MADEEPKEGGFQIILTSLRGGANPSVASAELSRMFMLDPRVAEQIIRKAPIILFKGLTEQETQSARPFLVALSRFGMDFRVTQSPPVNVPKVNWPTRPDFQVLFASPPPPPPAPAAPAEQEVTVQLLCPCCGSTLRLRLDALSEAPGASAMRVEKAASPETVPAAEAEAPPPETVAAGPAAAAPPAPVEEGEAAPAAVETAVALVVAETELDHPWCEGPYPAVPVDEVQEDREFSGIGAEPLGETLFGPVDEVEAPAPAGETAPAEAAGAPQTAGENLVEVEPQDVSGGIEDLGGGGEEVVPVESGGEVRDEVTVADDELEPWTGSARAYDPKTAKTEEKGEPAAAGEGEEDDLEPWTGSARAYKPKKESGEEKEEKPKPAKKAKKAIDESLEDLDDVPDIDVAGPDEMGMDKALVADVDEKGSEEGFREGLEDLPELNPVEEEKKAAEESPAEEEPLKPKTGKKVKKKKKKKKKKKAVAAEPVEEKPEPVEEAPAAKEKPKKIKKKKKLTKGKKSKPKEEEEGEVGGEYSVFLSKIVSADRRRKAVEILTEVKDISEGDAEKLTNKMIIPVVKGVGKEEAETILERFKKSKISGRITRKKA